MSDSKSFIISLLELMISSKNKHDFICNLSNLTLHIIFDARWASINVGAKRSNPWNIARHPALWRFYLHYIIEETRSPRIISIISHQVLRHPSEHRTSSMWSPWEAIAHIMELNELTE